MAIVNTVIGDCPGCGEKDCFGNVMVSGATLLRGCRRCKYRSRLALPKLKKKIVYLDQSLLSSAFKLRHLKSVDAVKRVSELASKQLLVSPHSNIHEDETHLWPGFGGQTAEQLLSFIKKSARGLHLRPHYEVEKEQMYRAFQSFLKKGPVEYPLLQGDVFRDDPHEWHNYVYITVQRKPFGLEQQRASKERSTRDIVDAFTAWKSTKSTFDQDVALEINEARRAYIEHYMASLNRQLAGDMSAIFNATSATDCMRMLVRGLHKTVSPKDAVQSLVEFLSSDYFSQIPQLIISVRIFAQLRHMARSGAYSNPEKAEDKLGGTLDDVRHVATYAPYCDAIFVDNAMASILLESRVGVRTLYGTEIFSLNTLDGFHAWLDGVDAAVDLDHVTYLERVYGNRM
jgi:hypothetical protein